MSPCPGGHHSCSGSCGHATGVRSASRMRGTLCCRKSSGSVGGQVGVLREHATAVLARAEAVHEDERQRHAERAAQVQRLADDDVEEREPVLRRAAATWRFVMPMLVPRPAVQLHARRPSRAPPSRPRDSGASRPASVTSVTGSISCLGDLALLAARAAARSSGGRCGRRPRARRPPPSWRQTARTGRCSSRCS